MIAMVIDRNIERSTYFLAVLPRRCLFKRVAAIWQLVEILARFMSLVEQVRRWNAEHLNDLVHLVHYVDAGENGCSERDDKWNERVNQYRSILISNGACTGSTYAIK